MRPIILLALFAAACAPDATDDTPDTTPGPTSYDEADAWLHASGFDGYTVDVECVPASLDGDLCVANIYVTVGVNEPTVTYTLQCGTRAGECYMLGSW